MWKPPSAAENWRMRRLEFPLNKEKRGRDFANCEILFSVGNRPASRHERRVLIFDRATIDPIAVHLVWPGRFFNAARKFHRNVENAKVMIVPTIEVTFFKEMPLNNLPFVNPTYHINEKSN